VLTIKKSEPPKEKDLPGFIVHVPAIAVVNGENFFQEHVVAVSSIQNVIISGGKGNIRILPEGKPDKMGMGSGFTRYVS
jgi:hypothetical protein